MRKFIPLLLFLHPLFGVAQQHNLQYFLQQAYSNNPDIKNEDALIRHIQFDSLRSRSVLKPQLNAHSRLWYAPLINGVGYDTLITNSGDYEATLQFQQSLLNTFHLRSTFQDLSYQKMSVRNNVALAKKDLDKEITSLYITCYSEYDDWQFQKNISDRYAEELTILHALTTKGLYHETDYLALQVNVQSQQALQEEALMHYRNDLSNLNALCGLVDTVLAVLDSPDIHLNNFQPFQLSPFAFKFKIDSMQNSNKKSLVDLNYKPKLNLIADAGLISSTFNNIQQRFGTSFGLDFTIPIYDGNQRNLQYQQIDVDQEVISNNQEFVREQYEQNVLSLQQQLNETKKWIADLKKNAAAIESLIAIQKNQLNSAQVSITDLILTMNNYLQSRNQLRQAELKQLELINELNYSGNQL